MSFDTPEAIRKDQERAGRTLSMPHKRQPYRPARKPQNKQHTKRDKVAGHEADLHRAVKDALPVRIEFNDGVTVETTLTGFDSYTVTYQYGSYRVVAFKQSISTIAIPVAKKHD